MGGTTIEEILDLEELDFSESNISNEKLRLLSLLPGLISLNLGDTKVSDISPLSKMQKIEKLDLSYTQTSKEQVQELKKSLPETDIA